MSAPQFREGIRKHIGKQVTDTQIDLAWNSMLLDMPAERVELIIGLRKNHNVYLLSNTNEIHFTAVEAYMKKKFGEDILERMFDKVYLSHRLNMRKPDKEIFERILKENGLGRKETLFIDDSWQHIEGAVRAGIAAYHLQKNESIVDLFRN